MRPARVSLAAALVLFCVLPHARAEDGYVQMSRNLQKKLTLEFVDTPLTECVQLISTLTRVNIVLHPKIRSADPKVTLSVKEMDAANVIRWLTVLTETDAAPVNQAIFITEGNDEKKEDAKRDELALIAAVNRVEVDLPGPGEKVTPQHIMKLALALFEKENPKPTDFPGPNLSLGAAPEAPANPFFVAP